MISLEFLKEMNQVIYGFHSKERPLQKASNSEMKRWLEKGSIEINGKFPTWNEEIEFPITSFVLFSKTKSRITIF